jgi:hypothetical protein
MIAIDSGPDVHGRDGRSLHRPDAGSDIPHAAQRPDALPTIRAWCELPAGMKRAPAPGAWESTCGATSVTPRNQMLERHVKK